VALEMFGDRDALDDVAQASYAKNRMHMNAFNRQVNMAAALNGKNPADDGTYIDPFTGLVHKQAKRKQVWEDSVFVLPEGQTMCAPLRPDARADLMTIEQHRIDMTCAAFGIPKAVLLQNTTSAATRATAAGADVAQNMYMRAMDSHAHILAQCVRTAYAHIYGGAMNDVDVAFPYLPVLDIEDLLLAGELGFLSRETLAQHVLSTIGLPLTDVQLQGPKAMELMTQPEHKQKEPAPPGRKT